MQPASSPNHFTASEFSPVCKKRGWGCHEEWAWGLRCRWTRNSPRTYETTRFSKQSSSSALSSNSITLISAEDDVTSICSVFGQARFLLLVLREGESISERRT